MKNLKKIIKIVLIFSALVMIFAIGFSKIDGNSMMPSFKDGNIIIYNKILNKYKRFDVVIIHVDGVKYIKRIIGIPNDNLKYENDRLYVDNAEIKELYSRTITDDFTLNDIPNDKYLVLGDNRSKSYDGRDFGLVDISNIDGKVLFKAF